ncbi:13835_t:CDS:2 [Entrophospora sp. SA101]|nr:4825_t:CDS:2 [Entrophospora sp. SA101]CAJ0768709.1 13835_t:CDS:2 [Entrophospora sp. SA101]
MLIAPSGLRVDKQVVHLISGSVKQTISGAVEEDPQQKQKTDPKKTTKKDPKKQKTSQSSSVSIQHSEHIASQDLDLTRSTRNLRISYHSEYNLKVVPSQAYKFTEEDIEGT